MKKFIFCLLLLTFFGCRGYKAVESSHEAVAVRRDTVFAVRERKDSIYFRDSIIVKEAVRGDTVFVEKTAWKTRYKTAIRTDTVYVARTDSTAVTQHVQEKERPNRHTWLYAVAAMLFAIVSVILLYRLKLK